MAEPGFILAEAGRDGLVCIFEDDDETGWFYLQDRLLTERGESEILVAAPAYNRSESLQPKQEDVRLAWSADSTKCAVLIRGTARPIIDDFRAVINVLNKGFIHKLYDGCSVGIQDSDWLAGFEWTWTDQDSA